MDIIETTDLTGSLRAVPPDWAPRACLNCVAWDIVSGTRTGACRMRAPTAQAYTGGGVFALTKSTDWCMEWRPDC